MSQSSEKILHYLTGNENIETVDVEVLEKLVAENPYFPITQFLLAKKLKSTNEERYRLQAQKTALYFSNPFWLNYQLTEEQFEDEISDSELGIVPTTDLENDISKSDNFFNSVSIDNAQLPPTDIGIQSVTPTDETRIEAKEQSHSETEQPENLEVNKIVISGEEVDLQDNVEVEEEFKSVTWQEDEEEPSFTNNIVLDDPGEEINNDYSGGVPPAADLEVTELKEEMAGVTYSADETTEKFLEETKHEHQKEELPTDDEHDRMFQNIKAMLDASSEEASADTKDAVIPIDPYYTIDYFASQGIKLELDQNPQDQLGQHLKKFTQWLKHMKKLGPEDATEVINRTETEEDIQQIADSSNTVREVVTEAMASVLEKQGKKDKAIELYNKLSFLNPDKRAYFADKIKKLKGT